MTKKQPSKVTMYKDRRATGGSYPTLLDCRLCGGKVHEMIPGLNTCARCGVSFQWIHGRWCLVNNNWPEESRSHGIPMRHPITRAVREQLHNFLQGKKIPRERLRFLIGLLIDHHTALEERALRAEERERKLLITRRESWPPRQFVEHSVWDPPLKPKPRKLDHRTRRLLG